MTAKNKYLEIADVLQDLTHAEREAVGSSTRLVRYPAAHLFYMPDDPAEVLFILKVGRVQLYRMSADGRKLVIAILQPGAIFGHMALVGQGLHNTYAQALDNVIICVWSKSDVEEILVQKPQVALRFLDAVGQRLASAEDRLAEAVFMRVPARVASLLLRLQAESSEPNAIVGYTHQYLADILGVYRETVTQILNEFKSTGWIRPGRRRIEVLDQSSLQAIAARTVEEVSLGEMGA